MSRRHHAFQPDIDRQYLELVKRADLAAAQFFDVAAAQSLSAATVMRRPVRRRPMKASAALHSAVPVACVDAASNGKPVAAASQGDVRR